MQSECSRDGCRIRFERPRIQTKCSWNTYYVLRMYLECNKNVPGVSGILPDYFPIGYKMLPNLAFSLVNRCTVWTRWTTCFAPDSCPPARSALKRRGGQEKKEEEKTQKIIRLVHGWQRIVGGMYGHYARLVEALEVEDSQSFFNYPRMEPAMFDELVQSGAKDREARWGRIPLERDQNVWNTVGMP